MSAWQASLLAYLTAALLIAGPGQTAAKATLFGQYDGLLLDVQGNRVTGVFTTSARGIGTDDAPQFSCAFLLHGRLNRGTAAIETWTPGDDAIIPGQLTVAGGTASLRLQQDQDGCAMAGGDMVRSDFTLTRSQPGDGWIGVAMVRSRQAVLHAAPAADNRHAPYLVAFNAVAVLARQPGWVKVRYLGNVKPITGWLRDSDLVANPWPRAIRTP